MRSSSGVGRPFRNTVVGAGTARSGAAPPGSHGSGGGSLPDTPPGYPHAAGRER
jgi:hypothetical protein